MPEAQPLESYPPADDRGAQGGAPRSTPLTVVSAAAAGDDLAAIAAAAGQAVGQPIAIVLPDLAALEVWPPGSITTEGLEKVVEHTAEVLAGLAPVNPGLVSVPVRVGCDVVGVTAALSQSELGSEQATWLEAAAVAAAVNALMRKAHPSDLEDARAALLRAIAAGPPADVTAVVAQARRLGVDLGDGGVAICAQLGAGVPPPCCVSTPR